VAQFSGRKLGPKFGSQGIQRTPRNPIRHHVPRSDPMGKRRRDNGTPVDPPVVVDNNPPGDPQLHIHRGPSVLQIMQAAAMAQEAERRRQFREANPIQRYSTASAQPFLRNNPINRAEEEIRNSNRSTSPRRRSMSALGRVESPKPPQGREQRSTTSPIRRLELPWVKHGRPGEATVSPNKENFRAPGKDIAMQGPHRQNTRGSVLRLMAEAASPWTKEMKKK